jgi:hypothetical protein
MIDLENYLNCEDCRIKNECAIFRAVKAFYCISDLEYKNTDKVPLKLKQCPSCKKTMCKSLDGEGEITHECIYCDHKIKEKKQVTIDKKEYMKLKEYYKDALNLLDQWNNEKHKIPEEHQLVISKKEYAQLLKSAEILSALEYFDVKHWIYYKEAIDMLNDWNSREVEKDG